VTSARRTALLVDDERLARQELRTLLGAHPDVEVVGEADSIAQAARLVTKLAPDIVFLDIQLPGETGFELFDRVAVSCEVIFVTAHDAHALRAFDVNALDYLLKPVAPERLAASLDRARAREPLAPGEQRQLTVDDFIFLTVGGRARFLRLAHIVAVQADGDYTDVLLADGTTTRVLRPLKHWEQRLPDTHFVRIHRETIVHLRYVDRVEEWSAESWHVHLRDRKAPLVLSRRYAARLRARFG
jgi:two-component system LytT family response regulator